MIVDVLTTFPHMFDGPMGESIMGRARRSGALDFRAHDLREWTHDRHNTTDDEIYGGGQGLLMKPEPIYEALDELEQDGPVPHVILFSPAGERFDQALALKLATYERLLFVCGHYEGIDERVYARADRVVSIGDYILTGGEIPAMAVIDAVVRLLPGVLGDEGSSVEESFSEGLLEFPQYTRPAEFRGMRVPPILLSGDHARVDAWKREKAIARTARLRPDLLATADVTPEERARALEAACGRTQDSDGFVDYTAEVCERGSDDR